MSDVKSPPEPATRGLWSGVAGWVRPKDPDFLAIRRSARAAVVMPSVFAIAHVVSSNAQLAFSEPLVRSPCSFSWISRVDRARISSATSHGSWWVLFHFPWHGRLDAQGGIGCGHGRGGVRCPLRGDRHATGRDRIDRGTFALRIAGGGGPAGLGRLGRD